MKENKEKKIKNCDEISKLIKAFPKDIAALDKEVYQQKLIHKDLEHRNLQPVKSQNLKRIMNEKMSKRKKEITDLQIEEKKIKNKKKIAVDRRLEISFVWSPRKSDRQIQKT